MLWIEFYVDICQSGTSCLIRNDVNLGNLIGLVCDAHSDNTSLIGTVIMWNNQFVYLVNYFSLLTFAICGYKMDISHLINLIYETVY